MKRIITTSHAPAAIGPYNQAIEVAGTLYISGQIPIDPMTNEISCDDVQGQTKQVFKNIKAILTEAGYTIADVVKTTVFLADMSLFAEMNAIYSEEFCDSFPARSTIAVKGLPKNALVEIESIAVKG